MDHLHLSAVMNGHFCPKCEAGPFLCTLEDGQCDNAGTCNKCIKAEVHADEKDYVYRQAMQAQYDDEWSRY